MKFNLTLCFLLVASLAFAQKREIQKIEKAIKANNFTEANEIFESINADKVEADYKGAYNLANGYLLLGSIQSSKASATDLQKAKSLFDKAEELGYDNKDLITLGYELIKNRYYTIAQEFIAKKDYEGAAGTMEKLFLLDTSKLEYAYDTANLYYAGGNLVKSNEYYTKIFEQKFDGVRVIIKAERVTNGSVVEYESQERLNKDLKLGIVVNPSQSKTESVAGDLILKLVYLKKELVSLEDAKALFEKAQTMYVDDASLKSATPEIYLQLGMTSEYAASANELAKGVENPAVFDKLAESAQKNENWDVVIDNYSRSLNLEAKNFPALVNIANAYIQKGNMEITTAKEQLELYKLAIGNLEKAYLMKSDDKNVTGTLLQLYEVLEMTDKLNALKAKQ